MSFKMLEFWKMFKSRSSVKPCSYIMQRLAKLKWSPLFWIQKHLKKKKKSEDIFTVESYYKSVCESMFNSSNLTDESVCVVSHATSADRLTSTVPIEDSVLRFSKEQEEHTGNEAVAITFEAKLGSTMPGKAEEERNIDYFLIDISSLQLPDKMMTMLNLEESRRDKEVENDEIGNTISLLADKREDSFQHSLDLEKMENNKYKPQVEVNEMSTVIIGDGLRSWHDSNYQLNNRENDLALNASKLELPPEPFLLPSEIKYIPVKPINKYEQQEMADSNTEKEFKTANENGGLCGMDSPASGMMLLQSCCRLVAESGLGESSRRVFIEDELDNELNSDEIDEKHNIRPIAEEKSCDRVLGPNMITPVSLAYVGAKHNEQHWQIQDPVDLSSHLYLQKEEYTYVTPNMELTNYNQHGKVECHKKQMKKKFSPKCEKESMAESKSNPNKKKTFIRWKLYLRYRLCLKRKRNYKKKKIKYIGNVASGRKVCCIDDQTDNLIHLKVRVPVQSSVVSSDPHQFDFLNQVRKLKTDKSRAATEEAKSRKELFIGDFLKILTSTWHIFPNVLNGLQTVILLPAGLKLCFETLLRMPPAEERERMSYEWLRLLSFNSYPVSAPGRRIRLSQAGFYYSGNGTLTTCYACGVQHSEWSSSDSPCEIHRRISPHCPLLGGTPTYPNIPIMPEGEENVIPVGNNAQDPIPSHSTTLTMVSSPIDFSEASELSQSSTYELPVPPSEAPRTTMPQTQSSQEKGQDQEAAEQILSQVENPSDIGIPSINPESTVDFDRKPSVIGQPIESRSSVFSASSGEFQQEHSAEAAYQNHVVSPKYISLDNLAHSAENLELVSSPPRSLECSKYPDYALLSSRITSYTKWPSHLVQTPQQLAEAGFFYTGQDDYTRCFHCGGGLCSWDPGDIPWIEHAKWYHHCAYVLRKKGQKFVNTVREQAELLEVQNNDQNNSTHTTTPPSGAACNFDSLSEQPATKMDQVVKVIADNDKSTRVVCCNDVTVMELDRLTQHYDGNPLIPSTTTVATTGATEGSNTKSHLNQIAGGISHGQHILQSRQQIGNSSQFEAHNAEHNNYRTTTKQIPGGACNAYSLSKQQSDELEAIIKDLKADTESIARTVRNNDASIAELRQEIDCLSQNSSSPLMSSTKTTTHASHTRHHSSSTADGRSDRKNAGGRSHRQNAGGRSHRQQTSQSRQHSGRSYQVSDQTSSNRPRAPDWQNRSDPISIPPSFVPLGNHQSNMLPAANSQQSSQQPRVEHLPNQDTPFVRGECCHQAGEQPWCKICMERMVELAFIPCGHAVSCSECGTALRLCPICRVKIRSSMRIYI